MKFLARLSILRYTNCRTRWKVKVMNQRIIVALNPKNSRYKTKNLDVEKDLHPLGDEDPIT
jgi:hypothetical protein